MDIKYRIQRLKNEVTEVCSLIIDEGFKSEPFKPFEVPYIRYEDFKELCGELGYVVESTDIFRDNFYTFKIKGKDLEYCITIDNYSGHTSSIFLTE